MFIEVLDGQHSTIGNLVAWFQLLFFSCMDRHKISIVISNVHKIQLVAGINY